jgi:hypothetical protein
MSFNRSLDRDEKKSNEVSYIPLENKESVGHLVIEVKGRPSSITPIIFNRLDEARDIIDAKLVGMHTTIKYFMRGAGASCSLIVLGGLVTFSVGDDDSDKVTGLAVMAISFLISVKTFIDSYRPNSWLYRKLLGCSYNEKSDNLRQSKAELAPNLTHDEKVKIESVISEYNHFDEMHVLDYKITATTRKEDYSNLYNQLTVPLSQKETFSNRQQKRCDVFIKTVNKYRLFGESAPAPIVDTLLEYLGDNNKKNILVDNHYLKKSSSLSK